MDGLPKDRRAQRGVVPKTIVTWAILVAMFVAVFAMFSSAKGDDSASSWWIVGLVVGVCFVAGVIAAMVDVRRMRAFTVEAVEAVAALHRGELRRANETFTKWWDSSIKPVAAVSRHNAAWTSMRQGELARAIEIQTPNIESYEKALERQMLLPTAIVDLAMFHALLGNLDEADKQLARLEQRGKLRHNPTYPAMHVLTRAIVACRRGNHTVAATLLEDKWSEWEAIVSGDLLRLMRVVRAFAIASVDLRDAGKATGVLGDMRPNWHGEFDFLGVEWPEMATFLATHNLATKPRATGDLASA
jgi:hypothetical protein